MGVPSKLAHFRTSMVDSRKDRVIGQNKLIKEEQYLRLTQTETPSALTLSSCIRVKYDAHRNLRET